MLAFRESLSLLPSEGENSAMKLGEEEDVCGGAITHWCVK